MKKSLFTILSFFLFTSVSFSQDTSAFFNHIDQLIQSNPDDLSNYIKRGYVYYELKIYDKAIPDISKVLEDMSDIPINTKRKYSIDSLNMLSIRAVCYREIGDINSSIGDFEIINKLDSNDQKFKQSEALVYLMNDDYKTAEKKYSSILKIDSTNSFALTNYALCLNKNGRKISALEILDSCITHDPDHFHAYRVKADILMENNESQLACIEYEKCLNVIHSNQINATPEYIEELEEMLINCK